MHLAIAYIKFLFSSTNQHGVHSPFVYDFVTKCLYKKSKTPTIKHLSKVEHIILKVIAYFNAKHVINLDKLPVPENKLFDIVIIDVLLKQTISIEKIHKITHNNSIVIIKNSYANKDTQKQWLQIKNHNAVTVTIDCFHLGFVCFRKEQAKEHFKIRV